MGRWRPPPPRSSPYITPGGFDRLQEELDGLWVRRRDVVAALSAAAAEGDRSENAEYIYRKKELAGIDRRIRYLQKRLPVLKVVRDTPDPSHVYFGARVTLERDDGEEMRYRIVGADETDARRGWISVDSPMARALLGKPLDAEVTLALAGGERTFVVVAVDYPRPGDS